jgi:hypothetical protein
MLIPARIQFSLACLLAVREFMKSRAAMVFGQRHMISLLLLFLILGGISKPAYADTTFYLQRPCFEYPGMRSTIYP